MTQTIPMDLMDRMTDINVDELSHHGILGMKWGIRRFQKYPAGYSGDGKYVGPDGQPRQPTRKEARRDRKYNELKTKIDKWLVDSVETGDKKTLKRLKKTMTPQQYQSAYDALVRKGIQDSVKTGNKEGLKKYKNDVSKNEYKDARTLADFNDAVNKLDTKRMNQLVGKIKNEDIKESAQRIAAMTEFQNKKIGALKVEGEVSAKLAKAATTAANVASLATSAKKVYDVVTGVKDSMQKRSDDAIKRANDINEYNEKQLAEKIIKKGDVNAFKKNQNIFTNQQIKDFYERQYLKDKDKIDRAILTGDSLEKIKNAGKISYAPVETLNKAKDTDITYRTPKWEKSVQDQKESTMWKYKDIRNDLQKKDDELGRIVRGADETATAYDMRKQDPKLEAAYQAKKADAEARRARIGALQWANDIMVNKTETDYNAYKALDATNQTWGEAISKKSADIKSTLSNKLTNTISDIKLSPAGKAAKRDAEAAAETLKNRKISAAERLMNLYNQDPEAFLNGDKTFIDPRKMFKD